MDCITAPHALSSSPSTFSRGGVEFVSTASWPSSVVLQLSATPTSWGLEAVHQTASGLTFYWKDGPLATAALAVEFGPSTHALTAEPQSEPRYFDYISGPSWLARTRSKKLAVGQRCELCQAGPDDLQCHHVSYAHVGHELPAELAIHCRRCHAKESGKEGSKH